MYEINISDLSNEAIAYLKKKASKKYKTKNNTPERGDPTRTTPVSDPEPQSNTNNLIYVGGNELFHETGKISYKKFMEKYNENSKS
tara:strand:- start:522 stop:779 length:258 start_codon:yes stop_codon:yes gene_type:complete